MYDVKSYSLSGEGSNKITEHFRVYEFACTDGSDVVFISQALVEILEAIRTHFGAAVTVNSGYRTVSYNASVKGSAKKSKHMYGLAADIRVAGHTPKEVYDYAETLLGNHGGLGIYNTFVHVDVRADKSRFDYRT